MKRAVLVLAACGSPAPAPTAPPTSNVPVPTSEYGPPPQLAGDSEAQCIATEPRAIPCMDQLFVADVSASLGVPAKELRRLEPSDEAEARKLHQINCLGDRDFAYMQNIVACWNERGCEAFVACVGKRTKPVK